MLCGGYVYIIPNNAQSGIIALALGDSVKHLCRLFLHVMLAQGLTGNPYEVEDITVPPNKGTIRFDWLLLLFLDKTSEPVRDIVT